MPTLLPKPRSHLNGGAGHRRTCLAGTGANHYRYCCWREVEVQCAVEQGPAPLFFFSPSFPFSIVLIVMITFLVFPCFRIPQSGARARTNPRFLAAKREPTPLKATLVRSHTLYMVSGVVGARVRVGGTRNVPKWVWCCG